jgi:hypothetical protein
MQSSSSSLPFKQTLAGASPATDASSIYDFGFTIYEAALSRHREARKSSIVLRKSSNALKV